jgi:hypothetical protein
MDFAQIWYTNSVHRWYTQGQQIPQKISYRLVQLQAKNPCKACAIDNSFEPSHRSAAQLPPSTFLALSALQLVAVSARYLRASLVSQPSFSPPEIGINITQWVDHFRGGIPRAFACSSCLSHLPLLSGYDEPRTLSYQITLFGPTSADVRQRQLCLLSRPRCVPQRMAVLSPNCSIVISAEFGRMCEEPQVYCSMFCKIG